MMASVFAATVANRWFVARRGTVLGVLSAASATGQLVFLPLLAWLVVHVGWRGAAIAVAGGALLVAPIVAIFMRNDPRDIGLRPYGATDDDAPARRTENPIARAFGGLRIGVRSRDFWLLAGSFFICGATTNGLIGTHLIPASMDHGIPEVTAASLLALIGIFDVVGTTVSGGLTDRFDSRWLLCWYYSLRGISLLFLPYALASSYLNLFAFIVFYGLDWVATVPPTVALTTKVFGKASATVIFGWIFAAHQFGRRRRPLAPGRCARCWELPTDISLRRIALPAGGGIGHPHRARRIPSPHPGAVLRGGIPGRRLSVDRARAMAIRVGIGALLWLACTTSVAAHAVLVRSDPPDVCSGRFPSHDPHCVAGSVLATPPTVVRLTFTEPIEVVGDGIVVTGPSGTRVDQGPARTARNELSVPIVADGMGTYFVEWRVTSDYTHPESGRYPFSVGQASEGVSNISPGQSPWRRLGVVLQASARWLHFVGFALGFGTLVFRLFVLAPLRLEDNRTLRRLVQAGIGILLLAEPCALLAEVASLSTGNQFDVSLAGTRWPRASGGCWRSVPVRRCCSGSSSASSIRASPAPPGGSDVRHRARTVDSEASHAVGTHPIWLGVALNALHIAAMGVWVGGLIAFLVVVRQPGIAGMRAALFRRFGRLAGGSFVLLVLTGAAMAAQHLAAPTDLITDTYGRVSG